MVGEQRWVWFATSIGCGLIILATMHSVWIRRLLEHRHFLFLGRISYSLYLTQLIVLMCVAPWVVVGLNHMGIVHPNLVQGFLLVSVTVSCVGLSALTERWIETPCIGLGKRVTAWVGGVRLLHRWRV